MNKTTDIYWSEYYDEDGDFMPASSPEISRFLQFVKKQPQDKTQQSMTALDIGCGTGQLSRELFHRGYQVVGVDASTSAIKRAKSLTVVPAEKLTYLHLDIETASFKQLPFGPYHLITCRLVFAFMKDKRRLLGEVASVLNKDGVFVVITPLLHQVEDHKKPIAVDRQQTKDLLSEFFSVDFYEAEQLGFFICRPIGT